MKKRLIVGVILASMMLAGCCVSHEWQEANCTTPKTCNKCQKVEGEPLGHTWTEETCTEPKKCDACGETEGEALGHIWIEATNDTPKICNICNATEGDVLSVEPDEYYEKGRNFLYGLGGNVIDLELAYNHFMQAKENGSVDANFYLGLLCDDYSYPEQDFEQAKNYYEASGENPYSKIALGFLYLNGQGVEEDQEKAKELFQMAIDNGCVEGYCGMGDIAFDTEDYKSAMDYSSRVVEGTEPAYVAPAMYNIGYMYDNGMGVEQDYAKALEWYEKAADLGNASAMYSLGCMYVEKTGVKQDYTKALKWFEKAADLGHMGAVNNIGYLYEGGFGVTQDYAKALEWYEKAANLGNTDAMLSLASMYKDGEGVEQNYVKALEWREKAANLGSAEAMIILAQDYEYGYWGWPQDYTKALEWYEKAAAVGYVDEYGMSAESEVERLKSYMQ